MRSSSKDIVLYGVNLIDGVSKDLHKDMVIITKDGIITQIGKKNEIII